MNEQQTIKQQHAAKLDGFVTLYDTGYTVAAMALALDIPEYDIQILCSSYEDEMGANDLSNYPTTGA